MVSGMHERGGFARLLATDGPTVFGTWVKLATLETVELLGHAGFDFIEIVALEGLSALFIGTGDLSLSSGLPASHPDNDALISRLPVRDGFQ